MDGAAPRDPASPWNGADESFLREELARADAALAAAVPVLRHLLGHDDRDIFDEEIVARVRAMIDDLVDQLLREMRGLDAPPADEDRALRDGLAAAIAADRDFLAHAHALAIEWRLSQRLQARLGVDPVLSPLIQALIGSTDAQGAGLAMNLLAAQARFCNAQRRMRLPLAELPGDILHAVLTALRGLTQAEAAETAIRKRFDEGAGRLGLLARVTAGMGAGSIAALTVTHAGVAVFLTALGQVSGQRREAMALATGESPATRLALALRAGGLKQQAIEAQFLALLPDRPMPAPVEGLSPDRAAAVLAGALGRP